MVFDIEKDRLLAGLEIIRRRLCAYGGGAPCDCKYIPRDGKLGDMSGEVSGCCEIYRAMDLIRGQEVAAKEKQAYDRGAADERARCEAIVDPTTTPLAFDSCNAITCLAAASNMITCGLRAEDLRVRDPEEVAKAMMARRSAQKATRKAARP